MLEEQLAQHAPVIRVVPDHLHRHHFRVSEDRVLVRIEREGAAIERKVELLVEPCVRSKRLSGEVFRDELGDIGVGDRDEVAARRVERIEEHARLARERPARAREHLLAAI